MANTFAHIELNTENPAAAKKFYKALFDWKIVDMPDMSYTMIDVGQKGAAGGGLQKKPMPEGPTQWLPYVMVDSVAKTIAKAGKLGAQVVLPFQSIGDMGAIGIFVDPTGAACGVWEAAKPAPKPARKASAKKPAAKKAPAKKAAPKKGARR